MIRVQREAKSRLSVDVVSRVDISSATIAFAFPLRGSRPTTFVAGTWLAEAVLRDGQWIREAITPRIGDAGAGGIDINEGHYRFYGQLTNGQDVDVWEIDEEGLEVQ